MNRRQLFALAAASVAAFALPAGAHVPLPASSLVTVEVFDRTSPNLRLQPAVHYHLGIGYSKMGQPELARLHLQNVGYIAKNQPIPEIPLATEALKSIAAADK